MLNKLNIKYIFSKNTFGKSILIRFIIFIYIKNKLKSILVWMFIFILKKLNILINYIKIILNSLFSYI